MIGRIIYSNALSGLSNSRICALNWEIVKSDPQLQNCHILAGWWLAKRVLYFLTLTEMIVHVLFT